MLRTIRDFFTQRDLSINQVVQQIDNLLYDIKDDEEEYRFAWPYIFDVFQTDNENYVIFSDSGKLYKAVYSVQQGRDIAIDRISEVVVEYPEVSSEDTERSFVLRRNADNQLLFIAIAGSAVLNRSGELDSTMLFDSFEQSFDKDNSPFITFRHLGEGLSFGKIDNVFRNDKLLFVTGYIDETTPIGSVFEERYKEDPEKWGISIGFRPTRHEITRVSDKVDILTYTEGELVEVSVLKETEAAHYFTAILEAKNNKETNRMGKNRTQAFDALKEFVGDALSDDELNAMLDSAEVRNRTIEETNMVTRKAEDTEDIVEEEEKEVKEEEAFEVNIDESALEAITEQVRERVAGEINTHMEETLNSLQSTITELSERLNSAIENINDITTRTTRLEEDDDKKIREAVNDLPPASNKRVNVRYRPTETEDRPVVRENEIKSFDQMSPEEQKAFLDKQAATMFGN